MALFIDKCITFATDFIMNLFESKQKTENL